MEKNDIVTVQTASGEYVGKLVTMSNNVITLDNPKMITMNDEGQLGFARGICFTGKDNPKEVVFNNAIFVTETAPQVSKSYTQAVTGLVMPS